MSELISAFTTNHSTSAITDVMPAFVQSRGVFGAEGAWPFSGASDGFAPNGKVIKNTHHHKRI